jgi:hypothetical protein
LIYINGTEAFHWTKPEFYAGILPQLTIYIGVIGYFFIKRRILKQIINNSSIN